MRPARYMIPVFVPHIGCPHACVFCNQRRISGAASPAAPEDVRRIIADALAAMPEGAPAETAFYGGSFTAIPAPEQEALLQAAREFMTDGRIAAMRVSTRPDCIDGAALDRLRRYGVTTIELGAQSMDDGVLSLSGRGHTSADTVRASEMIKAAGFGLILQMMTGLPGDDREKDVETARRIIALRPDGVRIYPTVIIRDTELYDLWCSGRYREHTVEEAVDLCAVLAEMFSDAGIPIIRLGLNPTDALTAGDAAGGAYHPAFGELVYSRVSFNRACRLLEGTEPGSNVTLGVHRGRISVMVGQHRRNITELCRRFGLACLKVRETDIPDGDICILSVEK